MQGYGKGVERVQEYLTHICQQVVFTSNDTPMKKLLILLPILILVLLGTTEARARRTVGTLTVGKLSVSPLVDHTDVYVTHADLPGQVFELRFPELVWTSGQAVYLSPISWLQESDTVWRWDYNGGGAVDYSGEVYLQGDNQLEWRIYTWTTGQSAWIGTELVDLKHAGAPQFLDNTGIRTQVYRNGSWVSLAQLYGLFTNKVGSLMLTGNPAITNWIEASDRVMRRTSSNGQWTTEISSYNADYLSYNTDDSTSCIHQNKQIVMDAGNIVEFRGWVKFIKNY